MSEAFYTFLEAEQNASPRTVTTYRTAIEAFRRFRPAVGWKAVSAADYRAWMLDMMKRDMARSSVRLRLSAMRAFHAFLLRRNFVEKNVLREVILKALQFLLRITFFLYKNLTFFGRNMPNKFG